jgi:hypothetical protein
MPILFSDSLGTRWDFNQILEPWDPLDTKACIWYFESRFRQIFLSWAAQTPAEDETLMWTKHLHTELVS